jgi:hypothetical protein
MVYAKSKSQKPLVEEFSSYVAELYTDAKKLIDEVLDPFSAAYNVAVHAAYESTSAAAAVNNNLRWLNKIDDADWVPATILALKKHENNEQFLLEFTNKMERLAAAMYLTSKTLNYRIERHGNIIKALDEGECDAVLEVMELSAEEKRALMDVLNGDIYHMPARKRTYAITRLDSFVGDNAYGQMDTSVLTIEHVLPQTPSADSGWLTLWPDSDQRSRWTHRIANLVPLTRKKNSQAQNYNFAVKKEKYFTGKYGTSTYALTTQVLQCDVWSPEVVFERQGELLRVFSEKWALGYYEPPCDDDGLEELEETSEELQEPIDHNEVRRLAAKRIGSAYNIELEFL